MIHSRTKAQGQRFKKLKRKKMIAKERKGPEKSGWDRILRVTGVRRVEEEELLRPVLPS